MDKNTLLILLISLSALAATPSLAEIKTTRIQSDTRSLILFERFGFGYGGHVSVTLTGISITTTHSSPSDPSLLGFFLLSDEELLQAQYDSQNPKSNPNSVDCVLESPYIQLLFNFKEVSNGAGAGDSFNKTFPVAAHDEYRLFFADCAPGVSVTMDVHTEIYNLDRSSGRRDYLPIGETQLPFLFSFFAMVYTAILAVWIYVCYSKRLSVHRIHLVMASLVLIKALYLICAAEDKHYVKVTGTPHGWDVLFYLFQFLKGVLLFTVIVLIGTGWSFLRPFLQEREKKVLMAVIPLQVIDNIASIVIGETGPFIKDWVTWNQVFLLIDVACCCAVIFPVVWSIRSLRETSKTDGKAARNLSKLTLFRKFYIVVVGYLYFTRIVVYALREITSYKYRWVSAAAEEIAGVAFYVFLFYMFRPEEKNEYFVLDEEEEEAAQVALREEEFEL
ncbi:hypothetical protein QJS10_CPB20g00836 [Acorus calamus]|uniref:Protein GPR107 n=1 Tax=Acorus calamus TaxID=4465 RepID=A0AAV9C9P4_ACOCL|nr:hypothetical protein QJS10_CPB20g00825 [Acorus calamus]KAK1286960.1 hypothetical protein QJS10_CPB20g00836 [Acorus calamus]